MTEFVFDLITCTLYFVIYVLFCFVLHILLSASILIQWIRDYPLFVQSLHAGQLRPTIYVYLRASVFI